ncbi:MAG: exodeoxyribonuclease III, partial [Firmicutes bacterium]|nr:exodeoxyribonuclease III [Bacillota bacterium]
MRFVSWNVNGFRACLNKGFGNVFREADADAFCLQETKMQPGQADFDPEGWRSYFHSAIKKGYSGTAVFCRQEPLRVSTGVDGKHLDEGRVLTLEYPNYYLVTCYTPNAQDGLARIDYRMEFEDDFRAYLGRLKAEKPTVVCGDLNVAHQEIDL